MTAATAPTDPAANSGAVERTAQRGLFEYMLLTETDRSALRLERAHDLEADLCRIEIMLEEPLDSTERDHLMKRASAIAQRLRVHLAALSGVLARTATDTPETKAS